MKHPVRQSRQIQLTGSYLYGDKLAETRGYSVLGQYFFSDEWGAEGSLGFFSSRLTEEAVQLQEAGATPVVYDPSTVLKASLLYQPVYGKLLVGRYIQHFRMGLKAGVLGMQTRVLQNFEDAPQVTLQRTLLGVHGGAYAQFPVFNRFSLTWSAEYLMYQKEQAIDWTGGTRRAWLISIGAGYQL